ncbi:bifunctional oligoribonuclease/PAP phosphatase NrnA [Chloroflexota bacterium]
MSNRVLLITHVTPDGDAIGSLLGLGRLLESQGKQVTLACEDSVPDTYSWLPGSGQIVRQSNGTYDLLIGLDCSDERRLGTVYRPELHGIPLVNIDHHVTNTNFGTVNWVESGSVATAQMVLTLAETLGWEIGEPVAVCLLTGMVTDTRSFRTSNVDAASMSAALRLMEAGAALPEITRLTLGHRPLASLRLWGQAIDGLQLEDGILWTDITRPMRKRWGLSDNGAAGLTNLLTSVREAHVVVVFSERADGTIDVGMRSAPGTDVAQVALKLGGGGHPQASGCTLEGELSEVRSHVLAEVRKSLADQAD